VTVDLYAAVRRVLDAERLGYDAAGGARAIRVPFVGTNGRWLTFARFDGTDPMILRFFAVAPLEAPEASRLAVMELVVRINHGLPIAALELDVTLGEIRMRTSLDGEPLEGATEAIIDASVRAAFWACVSAMDVYLPAILRVVTLGEMPADALAKTEKSRS